MARFHNVVFDEGPVTVLAAAGDQPNPRYRQVVMVDPDEWQAAQRDVAFMRALNERMRQIETGEPESVRPQVVRIDVYGTGSRLLHSHLQHIMSTGYIGPWESGPLEVDHIIVNPA